MDTRVNPSCREEFLEGASLVGAYHEQMKDMLAVRRDFGELDCHTLKGLGIVGGMLTTQPIPLPQPSQLNGQYRGLNRGHAGIGANEGVMILSSTSMVAQH